MAYELNEKMKKRTTYPVDTNSYKVRLDANESFIDPGKQFRQEIADAVGSVSLNRYPDDTYYALRKAFAEYYDVDPEAVMAGNGSDELISYLIGGYMMKGETLLTFHPDFSMYQIYAEAFERDLVAMPKPECGELTADFMCKAAKESNAAVILFSNPVSSIGSLIPRDEIIGLVTGTDALVVVDEAYMDFADQSVIDLVSVYDNLVVLRTCSKAFGCAGIRLGFSVASEKVARALATVRPPYNLNAVTEAIGLVIFSHPAYIRDAIEKIKDSRNSLYQALMAFDKNDWLEEISESQTNYIYIRTKKAQTIHKELRSRSVLVRELGDAIRVTAGTKEENAAFLEGLRQIIMVK